MKTHSMESDTLCVLGCVEMPQKIGIVKRNDFLRFESLMGIGESRLNKGIVPGPSTKALRTVEPTFPPHAEWEWFLLGLLAR
jgi:hypothetical protein